MTEEQSKSPDVKAWVISFPCAISTPSTVGAHRYNRTGSGDKGGDGRWQKWLSSGNEHSNTRAQPRPRDKNVALSKHHVTANNNVSNIHTNTGTRGDMVEPLLIHCWPEVSRRRYVKCWMVWEQKPLVLATIATERWNEKPARGSRHKAAVTCGTCFLTRHRHYH